MTSMQSQLSHDQFRPPASQRGVGNAGSQFDGEFSTFHNTGKAGPLSQFPLAAPQNTSGRQVAVSDMQTQPIPTHPEGQQQNKGFYASSFPIRHENTSNFAPNTDRSIFEVEQEQFAQNRIQESSGFAQTQAGPGKAIPEANNQLPASQLATQSYATVKGTVKESQAPNKHLELFKALQFSQKFLNNRVNLDLGVADGLLYIDDLILDEKLDENTNKLASSKVNALASSKLLASHAEAPQRPSISRELAANYFDDVKRSDEHHPRQKITQPNIERSFKNENSGNFDDPFSENTPLAYRSKKADVSADFFDHKGLFRQPTLDSVLREKGSSKLLDTRVKSPKNQTMKKVEQKPTMLSARSPLKVLTGGFDQHGTGMSTNKANRAPLHHYEQATSSSQKKQNERSLQKTELKEANKHWSFPRFGNLKKDPQLLQEVNKYGTERVDSLAAVERMHHTMREAEALSAQKTYMQMFPDKFAHLVTTPEPSLVAYYSGVKVGPREVPVRKIDLVAETRSRSPKTREQRVGSNYSKQMQYSTRQQGGGSVYRQPSGTGPSKHSGSTRRVQKLEPNIDRLAAELYSELRDVFSAEDY